MPSWEERTRAILTRASRALLDAHRLLVDVLEAERAEDGVDLSRAVVELRAAHHHLEAARTALYYAMRAVAGGPAR